MNTDQYLFKAYNSPPCWELVVDVYLHECDLKLPEYTVSTASLCEIAKVFRLELHARKHGFVQLKIPEDMCVVLMGKNSKLGLHHCGVFFQGSVLHALDSGNVLQDLASLRSEYLLMEFWKNHAN